MKTKNLTHLFKSNLGLPEPLRLYEFSRELREAFPDCAILETEDWEFDLLEYAERGHVRVRLAQTTHAMVKANWQGVEKGIEITPEIALFEVYVGERVLLVVRVQYDDCGSKRHWIIGSSEAEVNRFFGDVCRTLSEHTDEILVYHYGHCERDQDLYRAIKSASFDDLILAGDLKRQLLEDFDSFFQSEELYKRYGLAWRRGLILLGPPGNGKTHAVKALVQKSGKACLYVKSFKTRYGSQNGVLGAFAQARKMAPCVVVLEDIDSLVEPGVRSFFLNEMDGFAANRGLLVVATTNHPEMLDPAILDRPSRFDRKVTFSLPEFLERLRFLKLRTENWEQELRPTVSDICKVATATEGFSFAYLKELCLSSLMVWMRQRQIGSMGDVMSGLVETLRAQMATEPSPSPESSNDEDEVD